VLSDANERTFYDNNREKILFNKDDMSKEDLEEYSFGFNIWEFFSGRCFKGFGDDEEGFYSVYRSVFEKIKGE
jgi:DnaJ family protein A protein 5